MRTLTSAMARRLTILGRIQAMRLKFASQRLAMQAALIAIAILLGVGGIGMLMLCLYTLMVEAFGFVVGALAASLNGPCAAGSDAGSPRRRGPTAAGPGGDRRAG